MALIHPTYFSPIAQYVAIAKASEIIFETADNFQKQTYRNRCYIGTSQGRQLLNVPVVHTKGIKIKSKEVRIDNKSPWQSQHLKALQTAYSSSPFFEFYIDELMPLFTTQHEFLMELNIACHSHIMDALQLELPINFTDVYSVETSNNDFRHLANPKGSHNTAFERYIQVFETATGFLPNLSILDLLFCEGPNALNYLESQNQKHIWKSSGL